MAIGRPISLTPNIATKAISVVATASQTDFTVTGGYFINELSVYKNGVRLAQGRDFTANDGSNVILNTAASNGDIIEFQIFDTFNVADAIVAAGSSQSISGDLNVTGKLYSDSIAPGKDMVTGVGTFNSLFHVGTALTAYAAGDLETVGVITAVSFSGDGSALTGLANTDFIVSVATTTGNLNVSAAATITGDLTVSDSIAITKDINVGAAATITGALTGSTGTFSGAVNVDATTDSTSTSTGALIVDGGLGVAKNVYIGAGLSVAGTLTYEDVTSVDSVGLITAKSGVNITGGQLQVGVAYSVGSAGVATAAGFVGPLTGDVTGDLTGAVTGSTGSFSGDLDIADKIVHTGDTDTALRFPAANTFTVETAGAEDMRIASGKVGIGTNKVDGSGAKLRLGTNLLSRTQDFSDGGFTVVPTTGDTIATAQIMPLITAAGQGSSPNILRAGLAVESTDGRSGMDMLFLTRYAADGTALDATDDEKMRITDGGLVGIGTSSPLLKLHVQDGAVASATTPNSNCDACIEGTTSTGIQFLADSQIQLRFGSAGSTGDGSIIYEHTNDVFRINYSNSGYLSFRDGSGETFRFTPNNEIGIAGANYGTSGQVLTSGGSGSAVSWADASSAGFSTFVVLTSGSGASWSVPSGVTSVKVICTGGGGGGGASEDGAEAGGGGGAGGTVIHYFDTSGGGSATYTVGGGGNGASSVGSQASSGTDSTFAYDGTTLTGEGGSGGYGQQGSYQNGGGPGGTGSGGQLNLTGGAGSAGARYAQGNAETVAGGIGGAAYLGGSTAPKGCTTGQRTVVANTGSGGVGAVDGTGGTGSSGIIVIEY